MIDIKAKITKKVYEKDNYRIYGAVPTENVGAVSLNQYGNITLVGEIHQLTIDEEYSFTVKEEKGKYGLNYRILKVKREIDISNLGNCENFLREVLTERQCTNILKVYPNFIQKVINSEEIDVKKIKGVGEKSLKKIKRKIVDNFVLVDFAEKYAPYGLTFNMISKLYQKYPSLEVLEDKLEKEPYRTLLALDRVGFKIADGIILKINPAFATSEDRMRECIKFSLLENQSTGSTYMTKDELFNKCYEFTPECMDKFVAVLKESDDIVIHKELKAIALKKTYETEINVCNMILEMHNNKTIWDYDTEEFRDVDGFTLSLKQSEVAPGICNNNVYILGGVAGSGKTASVQSVVNMCVKHNKKFLIAAPTGKASDVISKTVGHKASTIHQMLSYVPEQGFKMCDDNKLDADLIIIDEFSMVDIFLIESLLEAVDRTTTKLLLVGDFAQLPSVGAGNVASDFVNTNVLPKTLLTEVFRYEEGGKSMVIEKVRQGKKFLEEDKPLQIFGKDKDYAFFDCEGEVMLNQVKALYKKILEQGNTIDDIMVLSAYNKGDYGVQALNKIIQELVNDNPLYVKSGNDIFKLGDKVMQTKNDYNAVEIKSGGFEQKGYIFNGSIGKIIDISEETIDVEFEGNKVIRYEKDDLGQLTLAYAITVHKCLVGDTKVLSEKGLINIKDYNKEIHGKIFNGIKMEQPSNFIHLENEECMKVTTNNGYEIEGTLDHRLYVLDTDGEIRYKTLSELKEGEQLLLHKNSKIFNNKPVELNTVVENLDSRAVLYNLPKYLTPELSELLGMIVADGTVRKNLKGIQFSKRAKEVSDRFSELVFNIFGYQCKKTPLRNSGDYMVYLNSAHIVHFLLQFEGLLPNKKNIPKQILSASEECQCAFLRGLFEDGTVNLKNGVFDHVELVQCDKTMIDTVHNMLLNIGIISTKSHFVKHYKGKTFDKYCIFIYKSNIDAFRDKIGFISNHKNERLESTRFHKHKSSQNNSFINLDCILKGLYSDYRDLFLTYCKNKNMSSSGGYYFYSANRLTRKILISEAKLKEFISVIKHIDDPRIRYLTYLSENTFPVKVKTIEYTGSKDVYCFTMPDSSSFVQNSFLGMNCQGMSVSHVIFISPPAHTYMLSRAILYVALTRARKTVYHLGRVKTINLALRKVEVKNRNTFLPYLIKKEAI